jgi:hypothetical protein
LGLISGCIFALPEKERSYSQNQKIRKKKRRRSSATLQAKIFSSQEDPKIQFFEPRGCFVSQIFLA